MVCSLTRSFRQHDRRELVREVPLTARLPSHKFLGDTTSSQHIYEVRPRKDKRGFDLISDALQFFFRNFAPPFSVEQVGMEAPASFPTNENIFALLRVARIIFESQRANNTAP